jgi:hypothetical protein
VAPGRAGDQGLAGDGVAVGGGVRNCGPSQSSLSGTTSSGYDADGSLTSKQVGSNPADTYAWDLRNRMASATVGGVTTSDTYDTDGYRVSETTDGSSTRTFLKDAANPSGYPQALEERVNGTLDRSYVLGLRVEAQRDVQGMAYLLRDGHGSTTMLGNADGTVITDNAGNPVLYAYDAFGTAVGFNAGLARTTQLFGGDGVYDSVVGMTYHDARWRQGYRFVSMDSYQGQPGDPLSLHKYLYTSADAINNWDPNGRATLGELTVVSGVSGMLIGTVTGYLRGGAAGAFKGAAAGLVAGLIAPAAFQAAGLAIAGYSWTYLGLYLTTAQGVGVATGIASTVGLIVSLNNLQEARTPGEVAAAEIELALSTIALGTSAAVIKTQGFTFRSVNPTNSRTNCANCVQAVEATNDGYPAQALDSGPLRLSKLAAAYDGNPVAAGGFKDATMEGIANQLLSAGNGSRGIVFFRTAFQKIGHVFNAKNVDGKILFEDGSNGATAVDTSLATKVKFMRTR